MKARTAFLFLWMPILALAFGSPALRAESFPEGIKPVATFSIVGFDPETGDLGVAVQSKFFGVGSVVPWAKAGVGAVATQSYANTTYGPRGLVLLEQGFSSGEVLKMLTDGDSQSSLRQAAIVDYQGRVSAFTGLDCNPWAGHVEGEHFSVQGNILVSEEVVKQMAVAWKSAKTEAGTELGDWLVAALEAGQEAGGDSRGRQSAALLVVRDKGGYAGFNDRYIDLSVEDHPEPIQELKRLLSLHKGFYSRSHANPPRKSGPFFIEGQGWKRLFPKDGEVDPERWKVSGWADVSSPPPDGARWTVSDGVLMGSDPRGTWLVSREVFGDFELQFEWKLGPRGNGGCGLRFPGRGDPAFDGLELQMVDPRYYPEDQVVPDNELSGGLYRAVAPSRQMFLPEAWNHYRVRLTGPLVEVWFNGWPTLSVDLREHRTAVLRHDGEPAGSLAERPLRGRIGFQELSRGGGRVQLRNVWIRRFE